MALDPKTKEAIGKVFAAGMKVLYAPEMKDQLRKALSGQGAMPQKLAEEIGGLIRILDEKAGGKIPKAAIVPAAMLLLQDLAAFIQDTIKVQISDEEITEAMQLCIKVLMAEYGYNEQAEPNEQAGPEAQETNEPGMIQQQPQRPQGLIAQAGA